MGCGTYHEFLLDESNGQSYCMNCGVREWVEPESDPDDMREMMQEAGLI